MEKLVLDIEIIMQRTFYQIPVVFPYQEDKVLLHFTGDKEYIRQYFKLREEAYIEEFQLGDFADHVDHYDYSKGTFILIARVGNRVIGGARLTICQAGSSRFLPLEHRGFRLVDILPSMELQHRAYSEVSRFAIHSGYRGKGELARSMIDIMLKQSMYCEAYFLFLVTPLIHARNYKKHCSMLNYHFEIKSEVTVPNKLEYRGRKMYLSCVDLEQEKGNNKRHMLKSDYGLYKAA